MASRRCSPIAWRSASSAALTLVLLVSCGSRAGSGVGSAATASSSATAASSATVAPAATVATGGAVSPAPSPGSVTFTAVMTTAQAHHDSGPTLVVGFSDTSRATIARLVSGTNTPAGRVPVAVFQGEHSTGGYAVEVTAIERRGDQLVVRATFISPKPGAMVTQALTSPAHVVSIASGDAAGLREAVLIDETGAERARINIT